ncbi:MAG: amidohydrolase family protein [Bacteroidetes bacterium]|nr:amidohydrolase family protein [Bacteroidota bacterium]
MQIIDTHIHIWDFDKAEYSWLDNDDSILKRTYAIEELEPEREKAGITGGVLVQAANNAEDSSWMLHIAATHDWIKGVVGWLPLQDPEATEEMIARGYAQNAYFKGVRHLLHDEPDARWLLQQPVIESLGLLAKQGLPWDMVGVRTEHIETALEVMERVPGLRLVFDHLNQPPIRTREHFGRWGELMKTAAQHPQCYAKISGLGTTSGNPGWSSADIEPYIGFALQHFGADRCFCGGDWPVSLLAGSYAASWKKYNDVLEKLLTTDEQEKVFWKNAVRFYKL